MTCCTMSIHKVLSLTYSHNSSPQMNKCVVTVYMYDHAPSIKSHEVSSRMYSVYKDVYIYFMAIESFIYLVLKLKVWSIEYGSKATNIYIPALASAVCPPIHTPK